jgi:hypothetical protein
VEGDGGRDNDDTPSTFLRSDANIDVFDAEKITSVPPDISYHLVATEDHCSRSPVIVEQLSRTRLAVNTATL